MPIYHYSCENCQFEQEQFLNADKDTLLLTCKRCHRQVLARQRRDDSVEYRKKDYVVGTVKHEEEAGV